MAHMISSKSIGADMSARRLWISLLFAAAVVMHFGVHAPITLYAASRHMFVYPIFGMVAVTISLAAALAAIALAVLIFSRGIIGLASERIIGFVLIYLIIGFQFA